MLNESQCRHVSATLRVNEERLLDLQSELTGASPQQSLLVIDDDLGAKERRFAGDQLAEVLRLITRTRDRLGLRPARQLLRQRLLGTLVLVASDLSDIKAAELRAYGDPDPRVGDMLDPLIDAMLERVEEVVGRLCGRA